LKTLLSVMLVIVLTGCSSSGGNFEVKDLAKSDIDMVADLHRRHTHALVQELMAKLYKRNPVELHKHHGASIEERWQMINHSQGQSFVYDELNNLQGLNAMRLGLSESFEGDRVFAITAGLMGMLHEAYGHKSEFFFLDSLDQQALYNSARNVEVLVWLLKSRANSKGEPLLLTDSLAGRVTNLSFERLFGKLIAHQDMLAAILADKTQRTINTVAHGFLSMSFIPL